MNCFRKFLILLLASVLCILPSAGFADDNEDDAQWAKLTEQNPITIDPAGGKAGFVGLPSADTTTYYARYNKDIYFKFPRNYLFQLSNITYGHSKPVVTFLAEMFYPDFKGATPETVKQFDFRSWAKSPNIIRIMGPFTSFAKINSNMLERESHAKNLETEYGLMKDSHSRLGPKTDVYFTDDPTFGKIILTCNTDSDAYGVPTPTCLVYVNLNDDLVYQYEYRRELLPHWREIHEHVTDFINSSLRKG